jgi:chromodomain-helicase-DNA-binding protein 1
MFTPPDPGPANGHASSSEDDNNAHVSDGNQSDSDLSDAQPAGLGAASPGSADAVGSPDEGPELVLEEQDESSDSSDHDAVDDGDFGDVDAAGSPASVPSNNASDRDASPLGHPAAKRKAAQAIEDEYMRENPELYGLRRSV